MVIMQLLVIYLKKAIEKESTNNNPYVNILVAKKADNIYLR